MSKDIKITEGFSSVLPRPKTVIQVIKSGENLIVLDSAGVIWHGFFEGFKGRGNNAKMYYSWTKTVGPHDKQ